MITHIIDFLVNELLWSLTWGKFQISLSFIVSWMLFVFIGKLRTLPAIILTVTSYLFAILVYTAFVAVLFVNFFKWRYVEGGGYVVTPLYASVSLGVIYALLQGLFYLIVSYRYRFSVIQFFSLSLVSNILSALIASYFIHL